MTALALWLAISLLFSPLGALNSCYNVNGACGTKVLGFAVTNAGSGTGNNLPVTKLNGFAVTGPLLNQFEDPF